MIGYLSMMEISKLLPRLSETVVFGHNFTFIAVSGRIVDIVLKYIQTSDIETAAYIERLLRGSPLLEMVFGHPFCVSG